MDHSSTRSATGDTGRTVLALVAILSLVLSLFAIARPAIANHEPPDGPEVTPTAEEFAGGEPTCPTGSVGIRFNNPETDDSQTVMLADGSTATVTILSIADNELTFEVTGGLAAVVKVKGGVSTPGVDDQNVYDYTGFPGGGIAHDDGLTTPNDQGISHVDFCLVPIEGSIIVYKTDQTGADVEGATFEVRDGETVVGGPSVTDANGLVCFDGLVVGKEYTVVETMAPDGWLPADPDNQAVTAVQGSCEDRAGDEPDATFTNTLLGSLLVLKTDDAEPATALAGATFTITGPDGFEEMAESDANGWFCLDGLVVGAEYTVTETAAPEGYVISGTNPQSHVIDDTATCEERIADTPTPDLTFVNSEEEQPTGSITIVKEVACEECETRTPGFWFNTAGSHDDETNALMAELAANDGGSNAATIEVNIDGTVYEFATAADVRAFVEADLSGDWDGEEGLSRDGALLRHYLSTWLNVALNGDECDLLSRELDGQTVEEILAEAAAALEADDEDAEVAALEKLTTINESDDAEENPLTCGDSNGASGDGFTFELFAEADFPDGDPTDSGTTGDDGAGTLIFADLPLGTYVLVETGNESEQECEIVSVDGGVLNEDGTVTVEITEETPDVVLTIVNECEGGGGEENPGDITVIKETDEETAAAEFAFSASWDSDGFVLMGGDAEFSGDLEAGEFTVTEELTPEQIEAGWSLADIDCGDADVSVDGSTVTITLGEGESVTCTFTNEQEDEGPEGLVEIDKLFCFTDGEGSTTITVLGPVPLPDLSAQGVEEQPDEGCWTEAVSFTITGGDLEEPLEVVTDANGILEFELPVSANAYVITEDVSGESAEFFVEGSSLTAILVLNLVPEEEGNGLVKVIKLFCEGDETSVEFVVEGGDAPVPTIEGCEVGDATFMLGDMTITTEGGIALESVAAGEYTFAETDPNAAEFDGTIVVEEGEITTIVVFDTFEEGEQPGGGGPGGQPGGQPSGETPREGTQGGNPLPNTATSPAPEGSVPAALVALMMLAGLGTAAYAVRAEAQRRR